MGSLLNLNGLSMNRIIPRLPAEYQEVEYIYKPDNFTNPNFGLGIIAYGNKYGLEVKMQASQKDVDCAMAGNQLQICGYRGLKKIDNLPYQNVCMIYIRHNEGYYLGRQYNRGWYTKPDGTIVDNSNASPLITPCDTNIHIVSTYYDSESNTVKTFLDGVQKATNNSKSWENDLTAGTEYFVYGNGDSGQESFKGRIYYIKTFDPDRRVTGHFIPCVRKSDRRAGLYDIVNSVFKVSTYDYIKAGPYPGQRLPYDYTEVEYVYQASGSYPNFPLYFSLHDVVIDMKYRCDDTQKHTMIISKYPYTGNHTQANDLWIYNHGGNDTRFSVDYSNDVKVDESYYTPASMFKSDGKDTNVHTLHLDFGTSVQTACWDEGTVIDRHIAMSEVNGQYNLLNNRYAGSCWWFYGMKIAKHDGTVLYDLCPVKRITDGKIGLYNFADDTFWFNEEQPLEAGVG